MVEDKREKIGWDPVTKKNAVDEAHRTILELSENGFLDHGGDWVRAWYAHGLQWTKGKHPYITCLDERTGDFAREAKRTAEVFELAKFYVGSRLKANKPVPVAFRKIFGDYLLGAWAPRQYKVGRPRNWGRDFILIEVIHRLVEQYGLEPTRNTKPPKDPHFIRNPRIPEAASEILFEVLSRPGLERSRFAAISIKRIHNIWSDSLARSEHAEARGIHFVAMLDDAPEASRS